MSVFPRNARSWSNCALLQRDDGTDEIVGKCGTVCIYVVIAISKDALID